ncbi:MAG: DUF4926 domain-containing protein [Roseiflexus sp.]|nr:DUF4926 domain-containing protein [Roseiflexus sp.]
MKLPEYESAIVPDRKVTAYLLSLTHRDGRSKAAFFMRYGFTSDDWHALSVALKRHAADHEMELPMIEELANVALTVDLPEHGLQAGDIGAVVMVHQEGKGYTVEFLTLGGKTIAVVTVTAGQIRALRANEIAHARELTVV